LTNTSILFECFYAGIKSNFPVCCVLFFITEWDDFFMEWFNEGYDPEILDGGEIIFHEDTELTPQAIERVLCPECNVYEITSV